MRESLPKLHSPVASWMIFAVACAMVVIGAKIWMIARSGVAVPYWDQWEAEGAILYPRYLDGTLSFSDLIAPHNEHRILVCRLWLLFLFVLAGYWDPILQMLANTTILGASVALFVVAFRPILNSALWLGLALFSTVIFALPFDWANTLAGFHAQWLFLNLFSLAALFVFVGAPAVGPRWWTAVLLMIVSAFSLSSGALTSIAACVLCTAQFAVRRRSGARELLALAMLAVLAALLLFSALSVPFHASRQAQSIWEFLGVLTKVMSWPAAPAGADVLKTTLCAALIQAPALLASAYVIWRRPPTDDRRWLLVALTAWMFLQFAAVAYGRARGLPTASRYLDLFAVALPLNYGCLLFLLGEAKLSRLRRRFAFGVVVLWLLFVSFNMTKTIFTRSLPELDEKQAANRAELVNVRAYLDTGDIRVLQGKAYRDIPHPNPQRLAQLLSQPDIRAILPPELVGEASAARTQQHGVAQFTGRTIETLKSYALRWGVLLIPAGLVLFLMGLMMQTRKQEPEPTPTPG